MSHNIAALFARRKFTTHPRHLCFYLLPAGLTGWLWRFSPWMAFLVAASLWKQNLWFIGMGAGVVLAGLPLIAYLFLLAFSVPVLSRTWRVAPWTDQYDRLLLNLLPTWRFWNLPWSRASGKETKLVDGQTYQRRSLPSSLWHSMFFMPSPNSAYTFLWEKAPQTAMTRAGIMDMLSHYRSAPSPRWCSRPVIRWVLFWLYPIWLSFLFLCLWLGVLVYIKHLDSAGDVSGVLAELANMNGKGLGLDAMTKDALGWLAHGVVKAKGSGLPLPEMSLWPFLTGIICWVACSILFLLRMGRYLRLWLHMPPGQMQLLHPALAAQVPFLHETASFLESKATTKIMAVITSVMGLILAAMTKMFT